MGPAMAARRSASAEAEEEALLRTVRSEASAFVSPKLDWDDPARPAGSAYSEEEWAAAEAANPGSIIMEMHKPEDRALMAMPKDGLDTLLARSLVIQESVDSPWKANATAKITHHGEFGVFKYVVVRSAAANEKCDWVNGSNLVIKDKGVEEAAERQRSRADRFRG